MLIGNVSGMPQQGNPCAANPCGENNVCTSNGGAVSCECAPGKTIQKYNLQLLPPINILECCLNMTRASYRPLLQKDFPTMIPMTLGDA